MNNQVVLTEDALLEAAGPTIFQRGEGYVRYVHGLRVLAHQATASIQAKRVYTVRLVWERDRLSGDCSCPHRAGGAFCKHLVAVGLATLAEQGHRPIVGTDQGDAIRAYLQAVDRETLVEIIEQLVSRDEPALRLVQTRALSAGVSGAVNIDELSDSVSAALPDGFVDYRESFDVARGIQAVLDDIERLLDAGAADPARARTSRHPIATDDAERRRFRRGFGRRLPACRRAARAILS